MTPDRSPKNTAQKGPAPMTDAAQNVARPFPHFPPASAGTQTAAQDPKTSPKTGSNTAFTPADAPHAPDPWASLAAAAPRTAAAHPATDTARGPRARAATLTATLTAALLWAGPLTDAARAQAQTPAPADSANAVEAFASENAILDTSIHFAIGAREAQQSLRGSFGWPTFQEGIVEGVYFRFDPDGYARFAATPRLDTDVFEVICRPRTTTCMGRKGALSLILDSRGHLQIQIAELVSGDRFFVSEGVTEIELPASILQPLEPQMELLLATGGDLVVRRGDTEQDRISLAGFYAVGAYLRWVAANQSYAALPRGWPVPGGSNATGAVTAVANWTSPMPQPQSYPPTQSAVGGARIQAQASAIPQTAPQPAAQPLQPVQPAAQQPAPAPDASATASAQTQVAEVRGELRLLRELLLARNTNPAHEPAPQPIPKTNPQGTTQPLTAYPLPGQTPAPQTNPMAYASPQPPRAAQAMTQDIRRLQATAQTLAQELAALAAHLEVAQNTDPMTQNTMTPNPMATATAALTTPQIMPKATPQNTPQARANAMAKRLETLVSEIGLDPETALQILQATQPKTQSTKQQTTYRPDIVAKILQELEAETQQQPNPKPQNQYKIIAKFLKNKTN